MIDWVPIPAGPFPMGSDAADAYPPDEDERPRRVVRSTRSGSRAAGHEPPFHGEGDDRPVTYVSRAEAEAFCAGNGVRLPTEDEWEAAARGGDDRLWPWGDELPDTTRATFGAGHRRAVAGRARIRRAPRRAARSTWRATSSSGRAATPCAAART